MGFRWLTLAAVAGDVSDRGCGQLPGRDGDPCGAAGGQPYLVALDLPGLVRKGGYPGTAAIPPASRILSLLALKLTATRRVSHVDDLPTDPVSPLFAALSILPEKSALTGYSCPLSQGHPPGHPRRTRPARGDAHHPADA